MFLHILIESIPKYLSTLALRGLFNQLHTNASFPSGLLEIYPRNIQSSFTFTFLAHETFTASSTLLDIWGVDYPKKYNNYRFQINYLFLSYDYNLRIRQSLFTNYFISIPSLTFLYPSANWLEREVWDLFGVCFINHPDLRNILTDYGFVGKPLRKDFPCVGYSQIRFDDEKYRVVFEPLNLNQDFRSFSFMFRK